MKRLIGVTLALATVLSSTHCVDGRPESDRRGRRLLGDQVDNFEAVFDDDAMRLAEFEAADSNPLIQTTLRVQLMRTDGTVVGDAGGRSRRSKHGVADVRWTSLSEDLVPRLLGSEA